jgi:PKD repeat protein
MRSFQRNLCFLAALALSGTACGDDDNGGGGPDNSDPVAAFTFTCDQLACTFTDGSSDPDGATDLESWAWDFGGEGTSADQSPTFTFSAEGAYDVTLTVTDAAGATNAVTQEVTVSNTPNVAPTADFDFVCNAEVCTFTDASTDTDGTIASYAWDFGDTETSTEENPEHTYAGVTELTNFDVTLTVTDDDGATGTVTTTVAVAPPAGTVCEDAGGDFVPCTLDIDDEAVVTVTITSADCTADGNTLLITNPIQATVFDDGCNEPIGPPGFVLNGGTAFTAGTQLEVQMISGSDDPGRIAPAIRVTGSYPDWVLEFDDGEDPTGPGEPDFNDIVLAVHAEVVP